MARLSNHLKAIAIRQTEIENHCVIRNRGESYTSIGAGIYSVDRKLRLSQGGGQNVNYSLLIFDNQYAHDRASLNPDSRTLSHTTYNAAATDSSAPIIAVLSRP
mgnify:CR=1 FL=1